MKDQTELFARVGPRPWHWGYSGPDHEQIAGALKDLRVEAGYETHEAMAEAALAFDRPGGYHEEVLALAMPELVAALEYPFVDFHEYVEVLAQFYGVSPGTLLDELYLRAARCDAGGQEVPEEVQA